jgi:hypothetical protein
MGFDSDCIAGVGTTQSGLSRESSISHAPKLMLTCILLDAETPRGSA